MTESSPPAWGADASIAWRILLTAFDEVSEMASKKKIPMRLAAFVIAVDRVAAATRLRGI